MKFTLISAIWCPSCIIMRPRFYEIAKEKKITLNELDFDDDEKEVDKLNVGSTLPVLIIYDEKGATLCNY